MQRSVASGVIWSTIDSAVGQALSLAIYMVMARLLSPEFLGTVAVGALVLEFCRAVLIESIAIAVQARRNPTSGDYSAAFWLIFGLSLLASVLLFSASNAIERFSGLPSLSVVLKGFCIVVAIQGLSRTHEAWLARNQQFRSLAIRSMSSISVGGLVGIILAWQGFGVTALVAQQATVALVSLLALWSLTPWRPGINIRLDVIRDLLKFASYVALTGITNFANSNSDLIFVTWYAGAVGAGLYSLAKRLINAVSNVIGAALNRVFFSTIAGLQHDTKASAACFLDFVTYTALFTAPLFAGIAALAPELILVLFGVRWGESAPLLAIMSATGFLTTIGLYNHSVILAFGKPHWQTWLTFIYAVSNVAIFAVAAPFGVLAIAIGYVVRALLLYPLSAGASLRLLPIRVATYCAALMPAIVAATVMFAAILVAKGLMASLLPWQRLATLVPLGLLVYLAAIRVMAPSEMRVFVRTLARRT